MLVQIYIGEKAIFLLIALMYNTGDKQQLLGDKGKLARLVFKMRLFVYNCF